ncbi:MAG: hypothetical protein V3T83_20945, partial [Acidobacteriota bacterium]
CIHAGGTRLLRCSPGYACIAEHRQRGASTPLVLTLFRKRWSRRKQRELTQRRGRNISGLGRLASPYRGCRKGSKSRRVQEFEEALKKRSIIEIL